MLKNKLTHNKLFFLICFALNFANIVKIQESICNKVFIYDFHSFDSKNLR